MHAHARVLALATLLVALSSTIVCGQIFNQAATGSSLQALEVTGFPAPGELSEFRVYASPGASVSIYFATVAYPYEIAPGYLLEFDPSTIFLTIQDQIGGSGILSIPYIWPAVPPDFFFVCQAVIYDPIGSPFSPYSITNATNIVTRTARPASMTPTPPTVGGFVSPTNSTTVTLTGSAATSGATVQVQGGLSTVTTIANQGPIGNQYTVTVPLHTNAVNNLFIREVVQGTMSAATPIEVIQDSSPPELYIDFPGSGSELTTSTINIAGRVSDLLSGFMGLRVEVSNGQGFFALAEVDIGIGTNGTFNLPLFPLNPSGQTTDVFVTARDSVGLLTTKQISISRVPLSGARMEILSGGNDQSAPVETALSNPIGVKVTFSDGTTPFPGKIITFAVNKSNGLLSGLPGGLGNRTIQVITDSNGEAKAYWTLGSDAGCANNRVRVTSKDISGSIFFCASATAGAATQINIGSGDNQRGEAGATLPDSLVVWVSDSCNPVRNIPVTFTVIEGGGVFDHSGTSVTLLTDDTGHASTAYVLGPNKGVNRISATFPGNPGPPATFTVYGLERNPNINTTLRGVIFDNSRRPIGGVPCELEVGGVTYTTESDVSGRFTFNKIPGAGASHLHLSGHDADSLDGEPIPQGTFPALGFEVLLVPNAVNEMAGPVLLPPLNPANSVLYDGTETVELMVEEIDGLKMIIEAGTIVTMPNGTVIDGLNGNADFISLNQVHHDDVPMPMPDGVSPPFAWTLQPGGATFNPPIRIEYPNMTGLRPGAVAYFLSFNHAAHQFQIVAAASVTADGSKIVTEPGDGLDVAGWGCNCPPYSVTGSCAGDPIPRNPDQVESEVHPPIAFADPNEQPGGNQDPPCKPSPSGNQGDPNSNGVGAGNTSAGTGNPVLPSTGEVIREEVDFVLKGRGVDFKWTRTYRSLFQFDASSTSVQGNSWDHSYNLRLEQSGENLIFCDGSGRRDTYLLQSDGSWRRVEFFRRIDLNGNGGHTMLFEDQFKINFFGQNHTFAPGALESMVDRNGNTMSFAYDFNGRLMSITDTLGGLITLSYGPHGRISSITDFVGRSVVYEYYDGVEPGGSLGDLKSCRRPIVTGTPNGNDFPNGKKTVYSYSTGFSDPRRNHNLLSVTDARRNDPNDPTFSMGPYVEYVYATTANDTDIEFDHVQKQILGGHEIGFYYAIAVPTEDNGYAVKQTIVNDRVGNIKHYFYDLRNRPTVELEYTGRDVPTGITTINDLGHLSNRLRPGDPVFWETRKLYNAESSLREIIHPNGNETTFVYDHDIDPESPPRGYGNLRRRIMRPGVHSPAGEQSEIVEEFEYLSGFNACCGSQFMTRHVDGKGDVTLHQYDANGNRIKTTQRIASIIDEFEFNAFGQQTAHIWPANGSNHRRRDEFDYYDNGPQIGFLSTSTIDATGFALTTTHEYDGVGNLVKITDPRGHDRQFVYNSLNQVIRSISREAPGGGNVRYEVDNWFDANDNLTRRDVQNISDTGTIESNSHFTTSYSYDVLNTLVSMSQEVDSGHNVTTVFVRDGNRNLVQLQRGESTNGNQPENTLSYSYDERDKLFQETRAAGSSQQSTTQFDYDGNKNLVASHEGLEGTSQTTIAEFDGFDRLVTLTNPMGNVRLRQYDANGNVTLEQFVGELADNPGSAANITLSSVDYTFDAMDRLVRVGEAFFDLATQNPIDDGAATTLYAYSDNSQVIQSTNDNQHTTTLAYDTANRLALRKDAKNNTVSWSYDANSNPTSIVETELSDLGGSPEVFTTTLVYDNLDRLTATIDSVGNTRSFAYDSRNNRVQSMDAMRPNPATDPGNIVRYTFDGLNRELATIRLLTTDGTGTGLPAGSITTLKTWDDSSRMVGQTDDNGNTTTYVYDALDRQYATVCADGTSMTLTLDVHGNPVASVDGNGSVVTATFDLLNRNITKAIIPGPGVSNQTTFENRSWDGLSRLVSGTDDDVVISFAYDSMSNLRAETVNGLTTASTFDGAGNRTTCTYPGGRVISFNYDSNERISTISESGQLIASYKYVGPSRVARRTHGNGTIVDYEYDGQTGNPNAIGDYGERQIHRIVHHGNSSGLTLSETQLNWDRNGNKIASTVLSGESRSFAYDSIDRLRHSDYTAGSLTTASIDYSLDGVGNRLTITMDGSTGPYFLDPSAGSSDYQVNQYTSTPIGTIAYDLNGNIVATNVGLATESSYSWDCFDRLVSVSQNLSSAVYKYDILGRRVAKSANGNDEQYFYSENRVCEERDSGGLVSASYVFGNYIDEVIQMHRNGATYFAHQDDQWNVGFLTDAQGTIVEAISYGDFGLPTYQVSGVSQTASSVGFPYAYTGQRFDPESSFSHFRRRYLHHEIGRFITRDALGTWGSEVNIGNALSFVGNNPKTMLDPFGLESQSPSQAQAQWDTLGNINGWSSIGATVGSNLHGDSGPLIRRVLRNPTPQNVDTFRRNQRALGAAGRFFGLYGIGRSLFDITTNGLTPARAADVVFGVLGFVPNPFARAASMWYQAWRLSDDQSEAQINNLFNALWPQSPKMDPDLPGISPPCP